MLWQGRPRARRVLKDFHAAQLNADTARWSLDTQSRVCHRTSVALQTMAPAMRLECLSVGRVVEQGHTLSEIRPIALHAPQAWNVQMAFIWRHVQMGGILLAFRFRAPNARTAQRVPERTFRRCFVLRDHSRARQARYPARRVQQAPGVLTQDRQAQSFARRDRGVQ